MCAFGSFLHSRCGSAQAPLPSSTRSQGCCCLWDTGGGASGPKTLLGYFPFYLSKFKIELENLDQTLDKKYSSESPFVSSDVKYQQQGMAPSCSSVVGRVQICIANDPFFNNNNSALTTDFKVKQSCIMLKNYIYEKKPNHEPL